MGLSDVQKQLLDKLTKSTFGGVAYVEDVVSTESLLELLLFPGFIHVVQPWANAFDLSYYSYIPNTPYRVYTSKHKYLYTDVSLNGVWGKSDKDKAAIIRTKHADFLYISYEAAAEPVVGILWVCKKISPAAQAQILQSAQEVIQRNSNTVKTTELFLDFENISRGQNVTVYELEGSWNSGMSINQIEDNPNCKIFTLPDTEVAVLYPKANTWYLFKHSEVYGESERENYLKAVDISGVGIDRVTVLGGIHYIEVNSTYLRSSRALSTTISNSIGSRTFKGSSGVTSATLGFEYAYTAVPTSIEFETDSLVTATQIIYYAPPYAAYSVLLEGDLDLTVVDPVAMDIPPEWFIDTEETYFGDVDLALVVYAKLLVKVEIEFLLEGTLSDALLADIKTFIPPSEDLMWELESEVRLSVNAYTKRLPIFTHTKGGIILTGESSHIINHVATPPAVRHTPNNRRLTGNVLLSIDSYSTIQLSLSSPVLETIEYDTEIIILPVVLDAIAVPVTELEGITEVEETTSSTAALVLIPTSLTEYESTVLVEATALIDRTIKRTPPALVGRTIVTARRTRVISVVPVAADPAVGGCSDVDTCTIIEIDYEILVYRPT